MYCIAAAPQDYRLTCLIINLYENTDELMASVNDTKEREVASESI